MLFSKLFTKTIKEFPKDETSFNARELIRAGFIDKVAAGVYAFLPLGLRVEKKVENIVREEMDRIGSQEVLMPALCPKENWEQTKRWQTFDALFKLKGHDKKEYALGATHEEIITPIFKKYILSYKDLPVSVYQIQDKFRNELRAKAGLLRGREFIMKDMYSLHQDQENLDKYYETVKEAYFKIFKRLGLDQITYLTYASGGSFSKHSHEFQILCKNGEDTIFICKKCSTAINKEIIKEQDKCPDCGSKDFKEETGVEAANIFKLGTRYSIPFKLKYTDKNGGTKDVLMGCYGMGIPRLIGAVVEVFHDQDGIIWPSEIAPFQVHLISLNKDKEAEKIYQDLVKKGIEVLYDDRQEPGAGEKFADADLIGLPLRIVVSKKTLVKDEVEIKKRSEKKVKNVKITNIVKEISVK